MHNLMMKLNILLLYLSLFSMTASSQVFKGKVTAENGEPIPYAALYLREISSGFTTDDSGYFHTVLAPGKYTCEVSSLGYTRQVVTFEMGTNDYEKNIVIEERIYQLHEGNITRVYYDPEYAVMQQDIA